MLSLRSTFLRFSTIQQCSCSACSSASSSAVVVCPAMMRPTQSRMNTSPQVRGVSVRDIGPPFSGTAPLGNGGWLNSLHLKTPPEATHAFGFLSCQPCQRNDTLVCFPEDSPYVHRQFVLPVGIWKRVCHRGRAGRSACRAKRSPAFRTWPLYRAA